MNRDISVTRDISETRDFYLARDGPGTGEQKTFRNSSSDRSRSKGRLRSRYDRHKFRNERPISERAMARKVRKSRKRSDSESSCDNNQHKRQKRSSETSG